MLKFILISPQRDLDEMFKKYNVQENIDILHKIVTDAKDRKLVGDARKDTWREHLDPKVAVCARTIPVLNSEAARLRDLIAKVLLILFQSADTLM